MSTEVKTSQLSSIDTIILSSVYFVVLDETNTVQTSSGSTVKISGEDAALAFWGLSADYITDLTFVQNLSSGWQSSYTTVNTTSSTWGGGGGSSPTYLSGGTTNQILQKQSSTDYDVTWKNRRTSVSLGTVSSTSTINCNALSADQFVVTLSGVTMSATFNAPTNPYDSQIIMWNVRYQTNVAGVSLSSTVFRTPITTLNWSLSTNKMDIFAAKYNALDSKWDVISFAPGYSI